MERYSSLPLWQVTSNKHILSVKILFSDLMSFMLIHRETRKLENNNIIILYHWIMLGVASDGWSDLVWFEIDKQHWENI